MVYNTDSFPWLGRPVPVRYIGGHPSITRAQAIAAGVPLGPEPPYLLRGPGTTPVPTDAADAYRDEGEPPADATPVASTSRARPQRGLPSSIRTRARALAAQAQQVVASTSRIQRDPSGNDGDVDTTGEPDELDPESEEED